MCMMYNPTEFQVFEDNDTLVIKIKQKLIENCHKMTTLHFAFHRNSTLKYLQIF